MNSIVSEVGSRGTATSLHSSVIRLPFTTITRIVVIWTGVVNSVLEVVNPVKKSEIDWKASRAKALIIEKTLFF